MVLKDPKPPHKPCLMLLQPVRTFGIGLIRARRATTPTTFKTWNGRHGTPPPPPKSPGGTGVASSELPRSQTWAASKSLTRTRLPSRLSLRSSPRGTTRCLRRSNTCWPPPKSAGRLTLASIFTSIPTGTPTARSQRPMTPRTSTRLCSRSAFSTSQSCHTSHVTCHTSHVTRHT